MDALEGEANAWRFLEPWGVTPANATLERHTVYRFQARWVDGWRKGRLLLAGDAAHQMPPFAGQGTCSGLRDAANLAWKLDLVLAGARRRRAPRHVCNRASAARERAHRPVDVARPRHLRARPGGGRRARREHDGRRGGGHRQVPMHPVRIGPGLVRADDPHAGELFVQGRVTREGASGLFDDVVGRGWTLLSPHGDPLGALDPETRAAFATLGGVGAHVAPEGPVRDVDGTYRRWFDEAGVAVALQRPDFYVFGTAPSVDGAGGLVADLRRALGH